MKRLLLSMIFVAGCQMDAPSYPQQQLQRGQVVEEFASDPGVAMSKYRSSWDRREDPNAPSAVVLLALAGELMTHDPENYSEYYDYVISNLKGATDEEVVASAIGALSRAHGRESIDLLLSYARSEPTFLAREAMTALNYRLATSSYDSALKDDKSYILSHLQELCAHEFKEEIAQFCGKIR